MCVCGHMSAMTEYEVCSNKILMESELLIERIILGHIYKNVNVWNLCEVMNHLVRGRMATTPPPPPPPHTHTHTHTHTKTTTPKAGSS